MQTGILDRSTDRKKIVTPRGYASQPKKPNIFTTKCMNQSIALWQKISRIICNRLVQVWVRRLIFLAQELHISSTIEKKLKVEKKEKERKKEKSDS